MTPPPRSKADLRIVDHPVAQDRLARLRDRTTPSPLFRAACRELAPILVYEAAREIPVASETVETPLGRAPARRLRTKVALFPVLRAGLGLLDGALEVLPEAQVGFVGVYRDEETKNPVEYYMSKPSDLQGAWVFVLDPMLATGGSAVHAVSHVKSLGAAVVRFVCVISAQAGVDRLAAAHPDVAIFTAALDADLNAAAFIVPGLGDAGDRIFGL